MAIRTVTSTPPLARADRQQPSCNPPSADWVRKIGYSYGHSGAACVNRVRVSGRTCDDTRCNSPDRGYTFAESIFRHEPRRLSFGGHVVPPDAAAMGNVPSAAKEPDRDESTAPVAGGMRERNKVFHKRRKSTYLSSLLASGSASAARSDPPKAARGLFSGLLRDYSAADLAGRRKRGRAKSKNFHGYPDPPPSDSCQHIAHNGRSMTGTSVPTDAAGCETRPNADGIYANCEVRIGRSYNDRLYPVGQRWTQANADQACPGGGKHVYENMDFYLHGGQQPATGLPANAVSGPGTHEERITEWVDGAAEKDHPCAVYGRANASDRLKQSLDEKCSVAREAAVAFHFNASNTVNPGRCGTAAAPSLLDAINALGEEFGSESDSGSRKESGSSTSLASMEEYTFRSGSMYFSINEESTRDDYLGDDDPASYLVTDTASYLVTDTPSYLVTDTPSYLANCDPATNDDGGEEYSYFSFYADVHHDADRATDTVFVAPAADLFGHSCHDNDVGCATHGDTDHNFLYDTTCATSRGFSVPFEDLFPRCRSESDVLSLGECGPPVYENMFADHSRHRVRTKMGRRSRASSSAGSESSGDYLPDDDSEYEDAASRMSESVRCPGRSGRFGAATKLSSSAGKVTSCRRYPSSSVSTLLGSAKRPPQPPSRRAKDDSPLADIGTTSTFCTARPRLRSRSASFHRKPPADGDTKRRPASFGTPDLPEDTGSCPLQESICDESFQYTLSSACTDDHAPSATWLAERKKSDGNDKYSKLLYKEALVSYSKAIDLCPDCAAYYSNRSACYMMLGKYSDALADARESIRLDSEFVKGYLRVGKCNIALGDANAALSVLRHASDIDATKAVRDEINKAQTLYKCLEEINKFITKKEYRTAVFHIDKALLYAVACQSLKISKAENLVFLQRFSEAEGIVNDILQSDGAHPDAIYVRGLCLYYQDNQAAALTHFQHVLRLAPDHKKAKDAFKRAKALRAKKDAGNNAFNKAQWREALNLYTEAIAIDSTNSATLAKLYFNRATSEAKLDEYEESVRDCTEAINRNEDYVKAYVRRAKSNQVLEKHEEAVRDYEKASRLSNGHEYDRLLREAKIQLKRSKRKDYFKILGVSKSASDDEIKKAYRKKALMHHPDRHANSSEKERRDHEVQFKEIGEAYTILTDPKKKSMYENGHNINDSDDYNNYTDGGFDPTEIFQAFFSSGGGGTPYGAASGHGRQHFNFGGSSQGPFSFM